LPNLSVIIPAYNAAPYIGEALQSVFAQTFADYEVIVVNDGSPDTAELERVIAPYRAQLNYLRQENRGASAARNAGLTAARGELVAFLDADDVWLPSYLEEQVSFLGEFEADLVCADAHIVNEGRIQTETYMDGLMVGNAAAGEVTFDGLISGDQSLITSGVVARRQHVITTGSFDEALRNAQDFDLWIRLALNGHRLAYQRKALLRYRYHEGSLSGDSFNRVNRELRVFRKILATYEINPDQRAQVLSAIRSVERELNLVQGKEHLDRREFSAARDFFRKADALGPTMKLKLVRFLLAIWPDLLRSSTLILMKWRLRWRSAPVR
jgi:glycosyltransferase involved in cell wall biosynthesis